MEVTFAYFIYIKYIVVLLLLFLSYKVFMRGYSKISLFIIVFVLLGSYFTPIHYNGTNSDTYHEHTQMLDKYSDVNTTPVHNNKLTFEEVLQKEANYENKQKIKLDEELR